MMISRLARTLAGLVDPLAAGMRVLLLRLVARFGWKAVLIGAAVLVYAAARYRTWIWAGVAVLCAAAWAHAPGPVEELPDEADDEPQDEGEEPPTEAPVDPLPALLWELIGEAPGVHLKTVVAHLHQTGLDTACDRAAVRAALGRREIPVRGSVRGADGRVNEGVHRADLKAWEEARSPTAPMDTPETRSSFVATALTSEKEPSPLQP